jgi:MFS family permease
LNAGFLAAMVVSAVMLAGHVESWRYSLVLGISLVSALVGLFFLARVPDTAHVEYDGEQHPAHPVSLRVMIAHAPFRNFILFGFLVAAMSGGLGVFPVEYQRVGAGFTPSVISALSAAIFLGPILVLRYFGRSVDRAGGIPVMRNAMACFSFILLLWTLICAGIIPPSYGWVLVLNMTGGAALAVFSMASGHLLMELVPLRGKNHYFAMATVAGNLGLSLSPVIWGWLLERMHRLDLFLGPFHVTKYSVYFAGITLLAIAAVPGCMILKNEEAFRKPGQ